MLIFKNSFTVLSCIYLCTDKRTERIPEAIRHLYQRTTNKRSNIKTRKENDYDSLQSLSEQS